MLKSLRSPPTEKGTLERRRRVLLCLLGLARLVASAAVPPRTVDSHTDYPTVGKNDLDAGGGGSCTFFYRDHDATPVVDTATCTISEADLDQGCEPDETTVTCWRSHGVSRVGVCA